MVNFLERVPIQISEKFPIRNKRGTAKTISLRCLVIPIYATKGTVPFVALLRLEREVSDRRDAGGLIHTRNAEHDVLAALAVESHEAHNVATVGMAVADAD